MRSKDFFLPDFCHVRSVFALVVMGQLLAFILALATPEGSWQSVALISLYVQWIVLATAALLCVLRPLLARLGNAGAALAAAVLALAITVAVSELGYRLVADAAELEARAAFLLRALAIAAIVVAVVLRYLYVVYQGKRRLESEAAARVEALQARIRPHFLFNSLNTIASMIPTAPAEAEAAVEDLADLFRASIGTGQRWVSLAEEIRLAQGYLHMERLRLGERLEVIWSVDALPEDALLPPLTLQPLLENAVYYGIEPRVEGGEIRIQGRREGRRLRLSLCNPRPAPDWRPRRQGAGMARENIRERLELAFGKEAALHVSESGQEYQVELVWPYRSRNDEDPDRR